MTLSDTARRTLAEAAQHPLRLAAPSDKLPIAAARAVLSSLRKQGYVDKCEAPDGFAGLRWHQQDGTRPALRITEARMAAIGAPPIATATRKDVEKGLEQTVPDVAPRTHLKNPGARRCCRLRQKRSWFGAYRRRRRPAVFQAS